MPDNFDSNVARRKPNTLGKKPVHPWDVTQSVTIDETSGTGAIETLSETHIESTDTDDTEAVNVSKAFVIKKNVTKTVALPDTPETVTKDRTGVTISSNITDVLLKKQNDLSDTINIHSNYCKLDNDVSDNLLPSLSPSAQSVYLRLYRQSFGWNRNWAAESLPKLKKSCNISLQTVRKAIKELELMGCIHKEFSDYHKATVYRVFLPSEIGVINNAPPIINTQKNKGLLSGSQNFGTTSKRSQNSYVNNNVVQNTVSTNTEPVDSKILDVTSTNIGGLKSVIQSVYYPGTSVYTLLESGGHLPKNITKYMTDTHLLSACEIIDEFYESIGFSIVSRAQYRKSLIDYFDILRSGFSPDDIKYAVRWTFKNSRSRPESFSLIKYTIHDAMNDLIKDLKDASGGKKLVREKEKVLLQNKVSESQTLRNATNEDLKTWLDVISELKSLLNEHSFTAFIEPLTIESVDSTTIILKSPQDSISWVQDHFLNQIQETYRKITKQDIVVEIK